MEVSPGWTMGLEYRHYEFDDPATLAFNPAGAVGALAAQRSMPSSDTITAARELALGRPRRRRSSRQASH